jgi:hypothetical protein
VTEQEQRGGDESTNLQAGRDITLHRGPSRDEVRDIALEVFRSNFIELGQTAADLARGRAERLLEDFLAEAERRLPEGLRAASDPDMQRTLFNAQTEYACSGEEDLQAALVDLLVDRAGESDRTTRTVALNEAVTAAPKLTRAQRRAIGLRFILVYATWTGGAGADPFYGDYFRDAVLPLIGDLPTHVSDYQHIEYVGAGAVALGEKGLGAALLDHSPATFTRGFTKEEAGQLSDQIEDARLFIPALRDNTRYQVRATTVTQVKELAESANLAGRATELEALFNRGRMSEIEVTDELESRIPEASALVSSWRDTSLKNLTLTSVGLAIGHGYWRRATGAHAPLSIWLPS